MLVGIDVSCFIRQVFVRLFFLPGGPTFPSQAISSATSLQAPGPGWRDGHPRGEDQGWTSPHRCSGENLCTDAPKDTHTYIHQNMFSCSGILENQNTASVTSLHSLPASSTIDFMPLHLRVSKIWPLEPYCSCVNPPWPCTQPEILGQGSADSSLGSSQGQSWPARSFSTSRLWNNYICIISQNSTHFNSFYIKIYISVPFVTFFKILIHIF